MATTPPGDPVGPVDDPIPSPIDPPVPSPADPPAQPAEPTPDTV